MQYRAFGEYFTTEDDAFLCAFEHFIFETMGGDYWNNTEAPKGYEHSLDAALEYLNSRNVKGLKNLICYEVHDITEYCETVTQRKLLQWSDGRDFEWWRVEGIAGESTKQYTPSDDFTSLYQEIVKGESDARASKRRTVFVLSQPADMSAKDVVSAGGKVGIKLTTMFVHTVRAAAAKQTAG